MEGQEDQGIPKRLGVVPSSFNLFYLSLVFLAFILALPWAPGLPVQGPTLPSLKVDRNLKTVIVISLLFSMIFQF